MSKRDSQGLRIMILAYAHRYAYPILIFLFPFLFGESYFFLVLGIGLVLLALYDLIGYLCRWKHLFCSYQNAHRRQMTPHKILWHTIKKSDICGGSAVWAFLGIAAIVTHFFV